MNKKLKLLQKPVVLETLEVEQVKHELSQVENSTITMVAYDDYTGNFLIGDDSGDLYVSTLENLSSLNISADSDISTILSNLDKSSISEHFSKLTVQEAKEMFGDKYVYYWSANGKLYGVNKGIIERLDEGPDAASTVELWDREENVLSNDRGVNELTEIEFSNELRPAFLTFDANALPVFTRDENLTIHDPVDIADQMNSGLQNQDYVPSGSHYGYDMKDSNAVMKAYLGTDDLVVINNNDRRNVEDINPPTVDPDNTDVIYTDNTPFNHNYAMLWSQIRSGRLFEEFNDEAEDDNSNFAGITRYEELEVSLTSEATAVALSDDEDTESSSTDNHVTLSGAYANTPNLSNAYTTYVESDSDGEKQIYDSGAVATSIKNTTKWSLDAIDGTTCTVTRRTYNSVAGELTNAQHTYTGVVSFKITNIKDSIATIERTIIIPALNNAECDFDTFEKKTNSSGEAISLDAPEKYVEGSVEYSISTGSYSQGTNGTIAYAKREVYVQSGNTKYFLGSVANGSTTITGIAKFSIFSLDSNATTANIKRVLSVDFTNTDNTTYNFTQKDDVIGTGTVSYTVGNTVSGASSTNHLATHTRTVKYTSGSIDVTVDSVTIDAPISYRIYTLASGSTTATLKGTSSGTFNTYVDGQETSTSYTVTKTDHITVNTSDVTYSTETPVYSSTAGNTCTQTAAFAYTAKGLTIYKYITKTATISHSILSIAANATTGTIKRTYTPVFYTISAGAETSTIYKNNAVTIDTNQICQVSYSVESSPSSTGTNCHKCIHTRTATYTSSNNVSVQVCEDTNTAEINYTLYTLAADSTTATFKGSSTGVFNVVSNGVSQTATYNVLQSNHITVTSSSGVYSTSGVTYTSTGGTCTRTLTFGYTYNGVTVSKAISKTASVTHSLWSVTSSGSTIKRAFTPVFKTITAGAETADIYANGEVTIDTTQSATVAYTSDNTSEPSGTTSSGHTAIITRTITYTNGSFTKTINTSNSTSGNISYSIYTLAANSTTATLKGSFTSTFKTYASGAETTTTYNKSFSDYMTVTSSSGVYSTSGVTYTSTGGTCTRTLTFGYTYGGVTVSKAISKTASVTHSLWSVAGNESTIKRAITPVFYTISAGAETADIYANGEVTIDTTQSATVAYTSTNTSQPSGTTSSGHTAVITRTITYTNGSFTKTINTSNSTSGNISYSIYTLAANSTTATLKGSFTSTFNVYSNGSKSTFTYTKSFSDYMTVTSSSGVYSTSGVTYTSTGGTCTRTLTFGYTYGGVTVSKAISKTASVTHSLWSVTSSGSTIKRAFTPVFKTITAGAETSTVYANGEVTIDTTQSATVSYTSTNTSQPSGTTSSGHTAIITRTITYTNGSYSTTLNTSNSTSGNISYSIYTLNAGRITATLKGSFTSTFKTYASGAETTTTYNKTLSNHMTVTTSVYTSTSSGVTYTSTGGTCTHTIKFGYTYSGVTVYATISKSASVTHSLWSVTDSGSTIKRAFTPVFYTISAGAETSTVCDNSEVTIDTTQSATVSYTSTNTSQPSGTTSSGHTAIITRTITYTNGSFTTTINTSNSTSGNISYSIYTLTAGATSATLKGSFTSTFKTYASGAETTSTYTKSLSNYMTVTGTVTVSDNTPSYSNNTGTCTETLKASYTYSSVTCSVSKTSVPAIIDHAVKTLNTNATTATISRKYIPVIYTVTNGSDNTATLYSSATRTLSDVTSDTITYGTLAEATDAKTSVASVNRTITYSPNASNKITVLSDASVNSYEYTITAQSGTSLTYTCTVYGKWYGYTNGTKNSTVVYTGSKSKSGNTGYVTYSKFYFYGDNNSSNTITFNAKTANGYDISMIGVSPNVSYQFMDIRKQNSTYVVPITRTISATGLFKTGGTAYSFSLSEVSSTYGTITHLYKQSGITTSGTMTVTPVMSAAQNFTFKQYVNSEQSGTYTKSFRVYSSNPHNQTITPTTVNVSVASVSSCTCTIQNLQYDGLYIRDSDSSSGAISYAGTVITGSCSYLNIGKTNSGASCAVKCAPNGSYARVYYSYAIKGTWNNLAWNVSQDSAIFTGSSNSDNLISFSNTGTSYAWKYYNVSATETVTCGTASIKFQYISAVQTATCKASSYVTAANYGKTLSSFYNDSGTSVTISA